MTNLVNLERDQFWSGEEVDTTPLNGTTFGVSSIPVGAPAAVGQRTSFAQSQFSVTAGSGFKSVGCLILPPPDGDVVPYRVIGVGDGGLTVWSYGRFDSTQVDRRVIIGTGTKLDAIIAVPPLQSGDANYGEPLCFFASIFNGVATLGIVSISVQRLIAKPPQYATAVS